MAGKFIAVIAVLTVLLDIAGTILVALFDEWYGYEYGDPCATTSHTWDFNFMFTLLAVMIIDAYFDSMLIIMELDMAAQFVQAANKGELCGVLRVLAFPTVCFFKALALPFYLLYYGIRTPNQEACKQFCNNRKFMFQILFVGPFLFMWNYVMIYLIVTDPDGNPNRGMILLGMEVSQLVVDTGVATHLLTKAGVIDVKVVDPQREIP
jgi:hypothetical protein